MIVTAARASEHRLCDMQRASTDRPDDSWASGDAGGQHCGGEGACTSEQGSQQQRVRGSPTARERGVRFDESYGGAQVPARLRQRRSSGPERRCNGGHCVRLCHSLTVLIVCLAVWPMDKISHADAYTLEQVRRADYTTNCGLGFAGLHCDEVITCEELDYCSGHGICQRGGYCICDTGWEGATCKQSYCPSGCSGHGSCAATGGCVCDAGFTGVICNQVICLGGGNCTGHGSCLQGGICHCENGYLGAACDQIDVIQKCSNHGQRPSLQCLCCGHSARHSPDYSPVDVRFPGRKRRLYVRPLVHGPRLLSCIMHEQLLGPWRLRFQHRNLLV